MDCDNNEATENMIVDEEDGIYSPEKNLLVTFNFDNIDEKNIFLNKKIEEKENKGYIKVGKKVKTTINKNNSKSYPNPKSFKKTQNGYVYYDIDSNITCRFTGNEPSPKGLGLCARMVYEGFEIKGSDGNNWIKKGSKWIRKDPKNKEQQTKLLKTKKKDSFSSTKEMSTW